MERVRGIYIAIARLARCTSASVGESRKWTLIVQNVAETRRNLHQLLKGKQLYSALFGVYILHRCAIRFDRSPWRMRFQKGNRKDHIYCTSVHRGIPWAKKAKAETYRRRWQKSQEAYNMHHARQRPPTEVEAWSFHPELLRPTEVNWNGLDNGDDADDTTERQKHQAPTRQAGRPPAIVLTCQINLIQLQRQLKGLRKGNFDFRNTRNGTRVVTKEITDFSAIRSHFESNNLPYFTSYPKSQKLIKAVIRHLPVSALAEDISNGLVNLGFVVINIKQMSTTC
jgi:hypothetical protein